MKLSVVTVVFNDAANIEKTLLSVIEQTYKNIEHIIIDGNSTDGTKEIIEKYAEKLTFYVSEPDNGLYDAMNKAMKHINGDYVIFLNSGDLFFSNQTVEQIFASVNGIIPEIIYGDAQIIDHIGNIKGLRRHRPPQKLSWRDFRNGMLVSHQAFLPSAKILEPYNLKYKYSADYDWCIKLMKKATSIHNSNLVIVKFLDGGLTKKRMLKSLKERFAIMRKNYGLPMTLFVHIRNSFRMFYFRITKGWF